MARPSSIYVLLYHCGYYIHYRHFLLYLLYNLSASLICLEFSASTLLKRRKVPLSTPWRYIEEVELEQHTFLTTTLLGGKWLTSCPGCFTARKELLNRRLGGPQNLSGRFGEEKNLLPLQEFEPGPSGLIAIRITLFRLQASTLTSNKTAVSRSAFVKVELIHK